MYVFKTFEWSVLEEHACLINNLAFVGLHTWNWRNYDQTFHEWFLAHKEDPDLSC